MPDINFNVLRNKAMDVDPDIRFMALEDLRKFLQDEAITSTRPTLSSSLENIFPTLLNMLNDQNPDVQSQAVKSFEPMVRYLSHEALLKLIKKLFVLSQQEESKGNISSLKNFTVSIPNMALRSLFAQSNSRDKSEFVSDKLSSSNYRFDPRLARSIMDYLIPQIVNNTVTIDSIELLIDLIAEIGYVLSQEELFHLSQFLIKVTLSESGLIGKKSMVALEKVIALVRTDIVINKLLSQVDSSVDSSKMYIIFQLYSVILKCGIQPNSVESIYNIIKTTLSIDESDLEDLDFDVLVQENLLKDEAFTTLIDLVGQGYLPVDKKNEVIQISKSFLKFNPLAQDDDEEDEDEEEIVFSDEEDNEDDSENDGSWKLRAKASILVRTILKSFPDTLETLSCEALPILPFLDINDQVVNEAIKSAIIIVNSTSARDAVYINDLIEFITNRFGDAKEVQIPLFLRLIESLNRFNNSNLVGAAFRTFKERNLVTSGSFDYLQFYSSVLKFHYDLPTSIIEWIANDYIKNLEDKSFNMIIDTIKGLNLLFQQIDSSSLNKIVDQLIFKVENSKKYPSDLVRQSILALGEAYNNADKEKILNVIKTSIGIEGTNKASIDVLNQIYSSDIPAEYSQFILGKLSGSIMSSNEATSVASLSLVKKIVTVNPNTGFDDIARNLIQLLNVTNKTNYDCIFAILNILAEFIFQQESKVVLLQTIVKLVNENKIDVGDESFFEFLTKSCQIESGLYDYFASSLKLESQISAKILAICAIQNQLEDKIIERRKEFQNYYANDINNKRFAFDILFLGYVGSQIEIQELDIQTLIGLLQNEKFTNDSNIQAVSTALGLIARKHVGSAIPIILNTYETSNNTVIRSSLVDALSLATEACDEENKRIIWNKVFNYPISFDHEIISELRKSGELLGKVVQIDELVTSTDNLKTIYLILVVTKSLLNNLQSSSVNNSLLETLIKASIEWLDIASIEIRQIVVGNLLTGLHSKPEGLEIRKLCYEFIYSVISLDDATIVKNKINLEDIAAKVVEFGLTDAEIDITVLACINLINYVDLHKQSAVSRY
ncbi:hypothetical protein G210_0275 [Candida maltosa Xu316]|uniref:TATA-binding protein interacting (TIP20) domain-containing protein n=1 Tax=Candida maltosa (strain Xu316) TaxID=1245528 RepID=M3HNK0_CANMX|nr:hypothetical protein G210_0275 [Candida maltosa Xu316]